MASKTDTCNLALQLLGVKKISDIGENSPGAIACLKCYEPTRKSELQKNRWSFAILRASLAADVPIPEWGRANSFTLPTNCLKLIPPYPENDSTFRDWVIENKKIITNDAAPLYIRYIYDCDVVPEMDANFIIVHACRMALQMCEELTQSNSKKESIRVDYKEAIRDAKKSNAIQNVPQEAVEDTWIAVRSMQGFKCPR